MQSCKRPRGGANKQNAAGIGDCKHEGTLFSWKMGKKFFEKEVSEDSCEG